MRDKQSGFSVVEAVLLVTVIVLIGAAIMYIREAGTSKLSTEEIREKFNCDRITADVAGTDIYCWYPELYYEHLEEGTVATYDQWDDRFDKLLQQTIDERNKANPVDPNDPEVIYNDVSNLYAVRSDYLDSKTGCADQSECVAIYNIKGRASFSYETNRLRVRESVIAFIEDGWRGTQLTTIDRFLDTEVPLTTVEDLVFNESATGGTYNVSFTKAIADREVIVNIVFEQADAYEELDTPHSMTIIIK